jgi:multiple sugar transport system permease protein
MNSVLQEPLNVLKTGQKTAGTQRNVRRARALPLAGRGIRLIVLLLFAIFFFVPLLWLFLAPTKTNSELFSLAPLSFGSWQNVGVAWGHLLQYNNGEVLTWAGNSVIYAAGSLALTLLVSIPAGYALATIPFKGRSVLLIATLVTMIFPTSALVLPMFLELNAVHLLNTAWSVILPSAFFPFGVYLTYIYFATNMPPDLLNAGRIDGCNELQMFLRLALPLARPMVSLVAFFSFVGSWNNYFLPFVMLTDDTKYNLPVGLATLISSSPGVHPAFGTEIPIFGPEEALAGAIAVLPILIIFLFSQRYVIAGMFGGSLKG